MSTNSSLNAFNASNDSLTSLTSILSPVTLSALPSPSLSSFSSRVGNVRMDLISKLQLVYYIAIAVTGLVGNITTIFVFSQRRLRSLRSSFFLTCLAITDLIFILILVIVVLDGLNFPVMTAPICVSTIYLSHIASFLSSNFTLAYTSHRLIAVFFPMKAATFLKQRTNRILALAMVIFAAVFYSLSFPVTTTKLRSNTSNTVTCEEDPANKLLFPFLMFDTLFTFIIPFTLITCMNLAIVCKLQDKLVFTRKRPMIPTPTRSSTNSSGQSMTESVQSSQLGRVKTNAEENALLRRQNRSLLCVRPTLRHKGSPDRVSLSSIGQRRISLSPTSTPYRIRSTQCRATTSTKTTKMLLAASTVFLVFNLPYHLLLFIYLLNPQPAWFLTAVNMARLWFFASFCVNFFVYAICGQRFRNEVVRLFSCSFFHRIFYSRRQHKSQNRQNSIYLSHRLVSLRLSQSN